MVFTDIRLQNYRSYEDASFELDGGVSIIVGPNAAGKSNLIEALLLSANGIPYRGKGNLIKDNKPWARLDMHTTGNNTRTLKITREPAKEKAHIEFIIDNKAFVRLPGRQKQPAVLFEPNNLLLMHGEPQARRDYLDNLSGQLSNSYQTILLRYRRALAQRNALLKSPSFDSSQLFVWNIRLAELADNIVRQRLETIKLLSDNLSQTYSKISGKKSTLAVKYKTPLTVQNYTTAMLKKLEADQVLDKARGFTGTGPHREDFQIILNKAAVSISASRGETRTLLLALKIIELALLEENTGKKPLLLLDDVFSELDGSRRKALTRFLKKYQTIITTTDADVVLKNFSQNCQIIPLG